MDDTKTDEEVVVNQGRKWLYVGIFGLILCVASLGLHFSRGGSQSVNLMPKKVLNQVFGFTPYYFVKNKPPERLTLKTESARFFGNAFSFDLINSKNEAVTVSQKTLPADFKAATSEGNRSIETPQGTATINAPSNGRATAVLVTKDKTFILLDASDTVSSNTLQAILKAFMPIDKFTGIVAEP